MRIVAFTLIVAAAMLILGCSGGNAVPVTPGNEMIAEAAWNTQKDNYILWGLWQFKADPEAQTLEAVQLRGADTHLNALRFLEPPAYAYLTIENLQFNGNVIDVDIGLRHPFLGLDKFTGFDVCGVLISNGSVSGFDDPALIMTGTGDTRLLNPDGYTRWWNPAEFPHGGTMYNYIDGLLGSPDAYADYNSTINAYKYFSDELGPEDDVVS